jgi:hypothetical protein
VLYVGVSSQLRLYPLVWGNQWRGYNPLTLGLCFVIPSPTCLKESAKHSRKKFEKSVFPTNKMHNKNHCYLARILARLINYNQDTCSPKLLRKRASRFFSPPYTTCLRTRPLFHLLACYYVLFPSLFLCNDAMI